MRVASLAQFVTGGDGRGRTSPGRRRAERVKTLPSRPSNKTLLKLCALHEQASCGDVTGKRPGALSLEERAEEDARAGLKGNSQDQARADCVALVACSF